MGGSNFRMLLACGAGGLGRLSAFLFLPQVSQLQRIESMAARGGAGLQVGAHVWSLYCSGPRRRAPQILQNETKTWSASPLRATGQPHCHWRYPGAQVLHIWNPPITGEHLASPSPGRGPTPECESGRFTAPQESFRLATPPQQKRHSVHLPLAASQQDCLLRSQRIQSHLLLYGHLPVFGRGIVRW